MRLHTYWRSSAAYRVRIALNLKGIGYRSVPVDLTAGAQALADYAAINPGLVVPTLVLDDGTALTQSPAILEYLDEVAPTPPLLPADPVQRAHVRAAAMLVACDIHPVNNLRVLVKLKGMGHSQDECIDWMADWMTRGFTALSRMIAADTPFCLGDTPGLADICLVPQLYNARRWGLDLTPFARLTQIEAGCLALPAFADAAPENQPDAVV